MAGNSFMEEIYATLQRSKEVQCLNEANASPQVQRVDALTRDLAKNWNPTGFYHPDDVANLVSKILGENAKARVVLASAAYSTSDAGTVINQGFAYLKRNDERARLYSNAVAAARANSIPIINAPGLKTWVLQSLVNISQAYVTTYALDCRTTWLDTVGEVAEGIVGVAKRIGGVAAAAGDTILQAAEDVWSLYPAMKWLALAGVLTVGGIFAWGSLRRFYFNQVQPRLPALPRGGDE